MDSLETSRSEEELTNVQPQRKKRSMSSIASSNTVSSILCDAKESLDRDFDALLRRLNKVKNRKAELDEFYNDQLGAFKSLEVLEDNGECRSLHAALKASIKAQISFQEQASSFLETWKSCQDGLSRKRPKISEEPSEGHQQDQEPPASNLDGHAPRQVGSMEAVSSKETAAVQNRIPSRSRVKTLAETAASVPGVNDWTLEQDLKLASLVQRGDNNWGTLSKYHGYGKTDGECEARWFYHVKRMCRLFSMCCQPIMIIPVFSLIHRLVV
jgi:hypothetical protein